MSELKAGDSLDFTVGDKTLTVEAVPYGQIKKIMKMMFQSAQAVKAGEVSTINELIDRNLATIFPLVFIDGRYPFITAEWIENNMTFPVIKKILEAAVVVNGLEDFFGKAVMAGLATTPSQSMPATPSGNTGSTTTPDLATAGGPKTLTN